MAELDIPWADLISAYALATLIAAWAVGPAGNTGAGIDFAMADLIVSHFNEFVAAASVRLEGDGDVDQANELAPFDPHGVYPTEDGWIAIAVVGDSQRSLVPEDTRTRKAAILAAELRAAGIAAEEVLGPHDLPEVEQLASRDFFTRVTHPEWGERRLVGIPWRPYGQPAIPLGPPPLLETG